MKKHCTVCNFDSIFGKDFVSSIGEQITTNLDNITNNVEKVLDKVENGATSVAGIITSVQGIKSEVNKLKGIKLNEDGFKTISEVLHSSSGYLTTIKNDSSNVFSLLFNENEDLIILKGQAEGFVKTMAAFLDKAGNYSGDIADAYGELSKLRSQFDNTKNNFKNLTSGPLENRIAAVKNIVNGINSIMTGFPQILKSSPLSPQWLRRFGTQMEGITGGISRVLNKTSDIASDIGETIGGIKNIQDTALIIGNEFKSLLTPGGNKINIAMNIVNKIKTITGQINVVASNASNMFQTLTNITLLKTDIFGNATADMLDKISNGLGTVADRYEKFRELSKTISEAFNNIEDDPIKFALDDLPKLFNQTSDFVNLIFNDVQGVATKLGFDLDEYNLDPNLVESATAFYSFAKSTLGAIGSGKALITDFKALLNSKDFKQAMQNFNKVLKSGGAFLTSIDKLGSKLFEEWSSMKGSFTNTLTSISKSLGFNLKEMGGMLQKGLQVGGHVLGIVSNIEQLLNIKEFTPATVIQAANSIVGIANSGVKILNEFGMNIGMKGLETAGTVLGVVTAVIQLYQGIKGFTDWLKDTCDITYKEVVIPRNITYLCLKEKLYTENVKIPVENCVDVQKKVISGYGEGKICCPTKECVYMQSIPCLNHNQDCMLKKTKISGTSPNVHKNMIVIYQNFHNSSAAANARGKDVRTAEILVKRAKLTYEKSKAAFLLSNQLYAKTALSNKIFGEQLQMILDVEHRNKSVIMIQKVEFEVTTYKRNVKLLPLRITLNNANKITYLDISADFDKESSSFTNIAHMIVASYVNYIPLTKRRRRSLSAQPVKIGEDKDERHWALVCINYREDYTTLRNIMVDLLDGISQSSDNGDVTLTTNDIISSKSTVSQAEERLRKELEDMNTATTENVNDVIRRWRRTSELILSEDVGSVCAGLIDCFNAQIDNLTVLFEPGMKGYDKAVTSLNILRYFVLSFLRNHAMTKEQASFTVKQIFSLLDEINNNAYFCDEKPSLNVQMPVSVFAYFGEQFELECTIEGPASMEYLWRRNGTLLPNQNSWKLQLSEVTIEDQGFYTCEGKTMTSTVLSNDVLVRVFKRQRLTSEPEDKVLQYPGGQAVTFYCNGTSEPESSYKWWFKKYSSNTPVVVGLTGIHKIHSATSANVGHYWCELYNGFSSVYSRKAQLDIVRVLQRKETARLHLSVVTQEKDAYCILPKTDASFIVTTVLQSVLQAKIGLYESNSTMKLKYSNDGTDHTKAGLVVDIGMKQRMKTTRDSVTFALGVSSERAKIQSKVDAFVDNLEEKKGIDVLLWQNCKVSVKALQFSIDWQAEEIACPVGMGSSTDNVKCGKFSGFLF